MGATGVTDYIRLPALSHTASAYSYQWVTSLQDNLCLPLGGASMSWVQTVGLRLTREPFNCSFCHAEIIRAAVMSEKVACNK